MGLIDRIGKVAGGFGHAAAGVGGLIADIATAPWNDDAQYDGFLHTLEARGAKRGGDVLGGLFGPDQGLNAAVGALPSQVRNPVGSVIKPALSGAEWLYREGVGEPISTAMTAGSLADSPTWQREQHRGDITALFDPDTWAKAHGIAQHRSPGQAVALAFETHDILDQKEVEAAQHSDGYKIFSGVTDAVFRMTLDPTVVGGKAAAVTRTARITKPITAATDFNRVEASSRFARFNDALEGKSAAEIRHQYFPDNVHGAVIATTLADAGDAATRAKVLRLFMGDYSAQQALRVERADIAGQVERLTGQQSVLNSLNPGNFAAVNSRTQPGLFDDAAAAAGSELERTQAEIDKLVSRDEQLARRQAAVASITAEPRVRTIDVARSAVTRSEVFQQSTLAAPVRRAFTMRPHNLIDLNRPEGDIQIQRVVRQIGFDVETQDAWRAEYMRAGTPASRADVVTRLEQAGITHLAKQAGLTGDEVTSLLRKASDGRGQAAEILKSRTYDGEGRSLMTYKDDADGVLHEVPLLVSQTANMLPLTDFAAARQALGRVAAFKQQFGAAAAVPADAVELLYRVWKPSVLLRVGWPLRVVGDEQLRILAKIGAMASMRNLAAGVGNVSHNLVERAQAQVEGRAPELRGIGFDPLKVGQHSLESAFGDRAAPNPYFSLASSHATFQRTFETEEQTHLRQLRGMAAEHRSIKPDEPSYGPAWVDAVNNQLGRDPLAKVFLNGGTVTDGVKFLRSPQGREYASQIPERRNDLTLWAGRVKEQVDSYTLGNADLMAKAAKSKATVDDLFAVAPDAAGRPLIHGPILQDALGRGFTAKHIQPVVQGLYKALGQVPTDTLSRHPFFDAMYRQEASRRVALADVQARRAGEALSSDDLTAITKASREYALTQTRHLLYDLQEQSDLAHTLRFVMPFYSAWQETITRWAGLAVTNPAFIARMHQVWQAPEKAGIVTDENGTPVGWDTQAGSTVQFPDGTSGVVGAERYITVPMPVWAQRNIKGLRTQGDVRFNKRSLNLVLQGAPGFGPAVQVPVNEIVKARPDLAESLKAVLPFGAQQSTFGALMPATAKRISARVAGEEDRSFSSTVLRIYFDKITDYNLGKRDSKPTYNEAVKEAKSFYNIRAVASFISPAAPGFKSPYQPYIDAYRRLRAADPSTADDKFLTQFGQEYFALTQSLSKTADGVPPTVEAFNARSKYKKLIDQHPDLAGLIVGAEGAGAFSRSVYEAQFNTDTAPGSGEKERHALSFAEARDAPDVRLGWIEYGKYMDQIDNFQHDRGLPNLRVKGAADLAEAKQQITQILMQKHPAWAAEFQKNDRGAMQRKLDGLRDIAADARLGQRPEFQGLRQYFTYRQQIRDILATRDSQQLDAASNTDIAAAWESLNSILTESNPAFAALYHRHLSRDDLSAA